MIYHKIETIKIYVGTFLEIIFSILGEFNKQIISLILLMIIDTIFGCIKVIKKDEWTFIKAKWGIAGKLVELILIVLLYILNWNFESDIIVYTGLYYFIWCEIASILENYADINGNLPKGFLEFLRKLQFNIGTTLTYKLKKFTDGLFIENYSKDYSLAYEEKTKYDLKNKPGDDKFANK